MTDFGKYRGQGAPIPDEFGAQGAWIDQEKWFFYEPYNPDDPRECQIVTSDLGNECIGFRTESIANAIGITEIGLLILNSNGDLRIETEVISSGIPEVVRFRFLLRNGRGVSVEFCRAHIVGNA